MLGMLWPSRSAIRPVEAHAVVGRDAVERAESALDDEDTVLDHRLDRAREEFERDQPELARFLERELDGVLDETAQALGDFLVVAVARAFREAFGPRAGRVDEGTLHAVKTTFEWDEELRRGAADELLESDDVVAIGQPHLVAFVREQLDAALEPDEDGAPADVDLDAVAVVYRAMLIAILGLGQVVAPPRGMVSPLRGLA
ncbi:MAG: hypothetical protein HY909_09095 [Deltaproteobacteria bacterium]|nr:hypothetical protein [Deltaproteobacteria bacterium]